MPAPVPGVEVADHADPPCVGRPDREVDAFGALVLHRVRAHPVEEPEVAALADVVVVHRPEHRPEGIGVGHPPLAAGVAGAVLERLPRLQSHRPLEEAGVVPPLERADRGAVEGEGLELGGAVDEGAGDQCVARLLRRRAPRKGRRASPRRSPRSPAVDQADRRARAPATLHWLLGHRRFPRAVLVGSRRLQADAPDVPGILTDRAVGREPAHPRGVQDRLAPTRPTGRTRARRPRAGRRCRRRSRLATMK